jgi:hypothetical protein
VQKTGWFFGPFLIANIKSLRSLVTSKWNSSHQNWLLLFWKVRGGPPNNFFLFRKTWDFWVSPNCWKSCVPVFTVGWTLLKIGTQWFFHVLRKMDSWMLQKRECISQQKNS